MTAETKHPCPECQRTMQMEKIPYTHKGRDLGSYSAYVCSAGHEPYFTEEAARAIQARLIELGEWGAKAKPRISPPPIPG